MFEEDERWMRRAIYLAQKGEGFTSPNPMVGAVIVKNGELLGEGFHRHCGEPHAERNALAACSREPRGATLYVTLEPCCHHGRTPPCTDAIIAAGIRRVVIGSPDPNPKVSGQGASMLKGAGILVEEEVMRAECDRLNPVFFHYIRTATPFVAMKYAMTADGKIAAATGESRWITGQAARAHVHHLRGKYRGILVGIGTILADDPLLNCRLSGPSQSRQSGPSHEPVLSPQSGPSHESGLSHGPQNPVRIVCDSRLSLPPDSRICRTAGEIPTIVAAASPPSERIRRLEALGITVLDLPGPDGAVDLPALMRELARRDIDSVLLEGGSALNGSALRAGIVQKVYAYLAPKLLGGAAAKTPVGGAGFPSPQSCVCLSSPQITPFGEDLLLEYDVIGREHVYGNC